MWFFKVLALLLTLVLVYLGGLILLALVTEYWPDPLEEARALHQSTTKELIKDELVLYSWNLGYAGLGKDMDFFYDGGTRVRASREDTRANLDAIKAQIATWQDADAILLQEVDEQARRSWGLAQVKEMAALARELGLGALFAKNYDVRFVPRPFLEPLGQVRSGLMSLLRWQPVEAKRLAYPGSFAFPLRLFFLKRCALVTRTSWQGKELVLINTHNSAFDDGLLKQQEMDFLRDLLLEEAAKGNFVIAGGDWNQLPPGKAHVPGSGQEDMPIDPDFPGPGWHWVVDLGTDSNRSLKTPYTKGQTATTTLDFFLLSPNLKALEVRTLDLVFAHSDHNPVRVRIGPLVP